MEQERFSFYYLERSLNVCRAAMKSSEAWARKPGSFNQLLYGLMVVADNLRTGRPSIEDPPDSAA